MVDSVPFYENKKFITVTIVIAIALALFAMFSTTNAGMAFLRTLAKGVMP